MSITGKFVKHSLAFNGVQVIRAYSSGHNIRQIDKSVFISQSTDVFTNLALEHWFYRNYDFSKHHVLLLWRNDPCLVFGRHQNPWLECNVPVAKKWGITLARRNSGGGTVYHDNGNLNLTFFTSHERYNRRYNLSIIVNALFRQWGLKSVISERDDILVNGESKVSFFTPMQVNNFVIDISGTAAKLGRPNAYHHCTLLVNVNKSLLKSTLEKREDGIVTNATASISSPTMNLCDVNQSIRMDKLLSAIGWEYLRTKPLIVEDGFDDLAQQQKGFQFINPTEDWFPGINEFIKEFRSWEWNFGKTPKFTIARTLDILTQKGKTYRLNLNLEIENGIVQEIRMSLPFELASTKFGEDANVISNLRGTRYNHEVTENIIATIGGKTVTMHTQSVDEGMLDTATLQ